MYVWQISQIEDSLLAEEIHVLYSVPQELGYVVIWVPPSPLFFFYNISFRGRKNLKMTMLWLLHTDFVITKGDVIG